MPDTMIANRQDIDIIRRGLHAVAADFTVYSAAELLTLKNTTDVTSDLIRAELRKRDARMVDEACALKIGDAA